MLNNNNSSSKAITCRAVVCWGPEEPWMVEEIIVDPPKPSEVRMKLLYASVCHTDLLWSTGYPEPRFPRVLGHEGVGVIESLGAEVTEFKIGDVVIPALLGECGTCDNCKSDKTNLCLSHELPFNGLMPDGTFRMSVRGQPLYHLFSCSTWSEYTVIDARYIVRVDPAVDLPHASFLSCGFSTGYGAAWRAAGVESGSSVAVLGLGAVGLGAMQGSRILGARTVIGVDVNESKRGKGEAFGITHFVNPNRSEKSIPESIKELTGGMGVDYCFECSGVPALVTQALESTKAGTGTAVIVSVVPENVFRVNTMALMTGRTIKGTIFGGIKPKSELPVLFAKCKNREIQLDELVSHEIGLEEIPNVKDMAKRADYVKILIKI